MDTPCNLHLLGGQGGPRYLHVRTQSWALASCTQKACAATLCVGREASELKGEGGTALMAAKAEVC